MSDFIWMKGCLGMSKNKQKKNSMNILDIITQQNLRWVILICFVLSLLCEFLPSILDICKLFKYNSFIVFLQPHKDFFTNIILGCLGSAIISYIMLLIPQKVEEQEEKEEISIYLKQVISDFFILYSILYRITCSESFENSKLLENNIRTEKSNLCLHINSFLQYYEKTKYININRVKEVVNICQNKLLLAINEIDIFLNVYASLKSAGDESIYPISIVNEVYKLLYDNLEKNYDLKSISVMFSNIMPIEIAALRDVKEVEKSMLSYFDTKKNGLLHIYYATEICKVHQKDSYEESKD